MSAFSRFLLVLVLSWIPPDAGAHLVIRGNDGAKPGRTLGAAPASSLGTPGQGGSPSREQSRLAAERKIDSQLLLEIRRRRRRDDRRDQVPDGAPLVKVDDKGRAYVDVRAEVTPRLRKKIAALGSTLISDSVQYRSIIAWVPILKLEQIAQDPAVHAIVPVAEAFTNRPSK